MVLSLDVLCHARWHAPRREDGVGGGALASTHCHAGQHCQQGQKNTFFFLLNTKHEIITFLIQNSIL